MPVTRDDPALEDEAYQILAALWQRQQQYQVDPPEAAVHRDIDRLLEEIQKTDPPQ